MAAHIQPRSFILFCFFRSGDVFRYGKPCLLASAGEPGLVVCQRVRRVHQFMLWGALVGFCFGLLASSWCLVHLGGASFASHPLCVYKAWVSKMCLLLDTPCGRGLVGVLPLQPLEGTSGSS